MCYGNLAQLHVAESGGEENNNKQLVTLVAHSLIHSFGIAVHTIDSRLIYWLLVGVEALVLMAGRVPRT